MGKRIRLQRQKMCLTQENLAEMADISSSFVGHIERAEKIPSLDTVVKICESLEMNIEYCLFGKQDADQSKRQLYSDIINAVERYLDNE